jgi:cytoskeletal protein RodZ
MKENKVLYYINMSIIILLLNLFFILLIFYQLFLTRNIFKRKIIEGADFKNPNYNADLDSNAVNALYTNTNMVTPNSSNVPSNIATTATPTTATTSPIINTIPDITPTSDALATPIISSLADSAATIPTPDTPSGPIPADDNTIYNIIVKMINENNKLISSVTNVTLPTFVPDPTNSISATSIPVNTNSIDTNPYTFTNAQLFMLNFTVFTINNNNQRIVEAINKPDIIIPRDSFKTALTDSIPTSVFDFSKITDDDRKYAQLLQPIIIKLINENNSLISIPLNITMRYFNPR